MINPQFEQQFDDNEDFESKYGEKKFAKASLVVKIAIRCNDTNEIERTHYANLRRSDRFKWFSSLILWACQNNKTIEIVNRDDDNSI